MKIETEVLINGVADKLERYLETRVSSVRRRVDMTKKAIVFEIAISYALIETIADDIKTSPKRSDYGR